MMCTWVCRGLPVPADHRAVLAGVEAQLDQPEVVITSLGVQSGFVVYSWLL
jgi:hypothetical protein